MKPEGNGGSAAAAAGANGTAACDVAAFLSANTLTGVHAVCHLAVSHKL